jgi:hypothetical protein
MTGFESFHRRAQSFFSDVNMVQSIQDRGNVFSHNTAQKIRATLFSRWWWSALLLLIINDHLLKGSPWFPAALAGRLSDFAGLLMFPALAAGVLRVRTQRGLIAIHLFSAVLFSLVQLLPETNAFIVTQARALGIPLASWPDPSDLMALPALLLSFALIAGRSSMNALAARSWSPPRSRMMPTLVHASAVFIGLFSTVATVLEEPPRPTDDDDDEWDSVFGTVFIQNQSDEERSINLYRLNESSSFDCDVIADDPAMLLQSGAFGLPEVWRLPAGTIMAASTGDESEYPCSFLKIDGPGLPPAILFWQNEWLTSRRVPGWSERAQQIPGTVVIESNEDSTFRNYLSSDPKLVQLATPLSSEVATICQPTPPEEGLEWQVPSGSKSWTLRQIAQGGDGCYSLELDEVGDELSPRHERAYLCVPAEFMSLKVDDVLTFRLQDSGRSLLVERADFGVVLELRRVAALPQISGIAMREAIIEACPFTLAPSCDAVVQNLAVEISDATGTIRTISRGDAAVQIQDGSPNLVMMRLLAAHRMAYSVSDCGLPGEEKDLRHFQFVVGRTPARL